MHSPVHKEHTCQRETLLKAAGLPSRRNKQSLRGRGEQHPLIYRGSSAGMIFQITIDERIRDVSLYFPVSSSQVNATRYVDIYRQQRML